MESFRLAPKMLDESKYETLEAWIVHDDDHHKGHIPGCSMHFRLLHQRAQWAEFENQYQSWNQGLQVDGKERPKEKPAQLPCYRFLFFLMIILYFSIMQIPSVPPFLYHITYTFPCITSWKNLTISESLVCPRFIFTNKMKDGNILTKFIMGGCIPKYKA